MIFRLLPGAVYSLEFTVCQAHAYAQVLALAKGTLIKFHSFSLFLNEVDNEKQVIRSIIAS